MVITAKLKKVVEDLGILPFDQGYKHIPQPMNDESFFVRSLVEVYKEVKGNTNPVIVFLSSKFRTITNEMDQLKEIAQSLGLNSKYVLVQDLTVQNGKVTIDNDPIDIVYQKFDSFIGNDNLCKYALYENAETEVAAYIQGLKNKQFMVFNSFQSVLIAESKKILALLSMPQFNFLLSEEEKNTIVKFCPITFILSSKSANYQLELEEVLDNQNKFVIKSAVDTRGRNVFIGEMISRKGWRKLVKNVVDKPYVVQEYVKANTTKVISPYTFREEEMHSTLGMFMIRGQPSGLVIRSSADKITNVIGKSGCVQANYICDC